MGKLCMDCLETYHNDSVTTTYRISSQGLFQQCPKRMCEGKVFNIDDTILPTIVLLNSKGYETHSSCGGHALGENENLYIEFDEAVRTLPGLPPEFECRMRKTEGSSRLTLIYTIKEEDPYDHFNELLSAAEVLYNWSLDLEPVNDLSVFYLNTDSFSALSELLGNKPVKKESKEETIKKIKEIAPDGSIELEGFDKPAIKENVEGTTKEAPKRKRGRPKKEKE